MLIGRKNRGRPFHETIREIILILANDREKVRFMMDKLKKTAVLLGGVMLILLIIVWGIKHNIPQVHR